MPLDRAGKAVANETKYPFIIEVPVAANGLNVELNGQIIGFHKSRRIEPRFGRTVFREGQSYYRWCFPIWRRLAPLSNSLAEHFTKQPALKLCRR